MATKTLKSKEITIDYEKGAISAFFSKIRGKESTNVSEITLLRSLFSNEKARMLHVLKTKQPNSIYELAKILGRDFKSVREDAYLLENLGFLEMIPLYKGKRQRLKPLLVIDKLNIHVNL